MPDVAELDAFLARARQVRDQRTRRDVAALLAAFAACASLAFGVALGRHI